MQETGNDREPHRPDLPRRRQGPRTLGGNPLAGWSDLPALRQLPISERSPSWRASRTAPASTSATNAASSSPSRSAPCSSAPKSRSTSGLLAMHLCALQEGHVRAPAPPHARRHLQDRLVHGAPHPRGDEGRRQAPARIGGEGKIVEADETYFGPKDRVTHAHQAAASPAMPQSAPSWPWSSAAAKSACSMSSRHRRRSPRHAGPQRLPQVRTCIPTKVRLYTGTGKEFAHARTVKHSAGEYVRYEATRRSTPTRSRTSFQSSSAA